MFEKSFITITFSGSFIHMSHCHFFTRLTLILFWSFTSFTRWETFSTFWLLVFIISFHAITSTCRIIHHSWKSTSWTFICSFSWTSFTRVVTNNNDFFWTSNVHSIFIMSFITFTFTSFWFDTSGDVTFGTLSWTSSVTFGTRKVTCSTFLIFLVIKHAWHTFTSTIYSLNTSFLGTSFTIFISIIFTSKARIVTFWTFFFFIIEISF